MKIIMIATKDYNFYNFRRGFILEMLNKGFQVCLVCPYGKKIDFFTEKGCSFENITIDRRGTNIFKELSLLIQCIKIFRKQKPDLVLTYTTKCSIYPGIACRILGIKYIVNNAGLIDASKFLSVVLNILYKIAYKGASCMMYQNTAERDYFNGILHNKVHYRDIPGSGVDLNEFEFTDYPESGNEIIFNYVGRIVELKGIKEFLDCAEIIKSQFKYTRFIIYGEYDDYAYEERIKKMMDSGMVEYAGTLLDMRPAIKKAHAVIHASHYEGMTNVVLEHSAMGRVCIGANIAGIKEGINDEVSGYLFNPQCDDDLIDKVKKFLALSSEERSEMGRNARKLMEERFDRNIVTNIYFEEINRIIN